MTLNHSNGNREKIIGLANPDHLNGKLAENDKCSMTSKCDRARDGTVSTYKCKDAAFCNGVTRPLMEDRPDPRQAMDHTQNTLTVEYFVWV